MIETIIQILAMPGQGVESVGVEADSLQGLILRVKYLEADVKRLEAEIKTKRTDYLLEAIRKG